jgi:nucleoside-diphosphate-sugar epimerase
MTISTAQRMTWKGKAWRSLDELVAASDSRGGTVLITGATGFLGGHFLYWWRRSGGRAVAVARAADERSARQRLMLRQRESAAAYAHVAASDLGAITTVPGDVRLPLCGLKAAHVNALKTENIESVWHFAANLRFEKGQSSELIADNVGGTRNAMAMAKAVGARRFVHISTAYSCGAADGRVEEELHSLTGPFNNAYEESKCRAEHLVISSSSALGLQSSILRPSIVVGPSTTWRSGGSESGFYGLLERLQRLSSLPPEKALQPIRIAGRSTAQLNLVPVDAVIRDCLNLRAADFPGNPIIHLTSLGGPMMCEAADVASELLGLPPIRIGKPEGELSHAERWLGSQLRFYLPYLRFTGQFARSLPSPTNLDLHDLRGLVANYARSNFAATRAKIIGPAAVPSAVPDTCPSGIGSQHGDEIPS